MRSKLGAVCMGLGAMLVLAALSLFLFNRREDRAAGAAAQKVMPRLIEKIQEQTAPSTANPGQPPEPIVYPDPYDPTMTEVEIDGYAYVGYVSIPALELELPVMSEWDYDRLDIASCRYSGSTKTDDLVICGHNYTRHFGTIQDLKPGDRVYFTDMDGKVWQYEVVVVDVLSPTDVEEMSAGEYDLTLFTCTYGGATRVTIRCDKVEE